MAPILIALAFVGAFAALIIVGTKVNLYFYSNGAIGSARSKRIGGLSAISAKSVPVKVANGESRSVLDLIVSTDQSSRYARGGLLAIASVFLLTVIAAVFLVISLLH